MFEPCSDSQLGEWALAESKAIEKALLVRGSPGFSRWKFVQEFQHCCSDISGLRNELVKRLRPADVDTNESDLFQELFRSSSVPGRPAVVDMGVAKLYVPFLRALGLQLKRREVPRFPTIRLAFDERVASSPVYKCQLQITLKAPREIAHGYIAVILDGPIAAISTDFQTSELVLWDASNPALKTMLAQTPGDRRYVLRIAENPFTPEVPIHVFVGATETRHVLAAFWYDE